ncbi:MAG: iron-sulfur cluster assembly scaffold protein [Nanoarchaeota archaeon]|nr:iron-sulfur cluster assembly scaffold protein [Nanoarchaeota archaeon]
MNQENQKERMFELYEDKTNFGTLKEKTHTVKHKNPICNDEIIIELKIENNKIVDAKFSGITCFISTISSAALLEKIKGMTVEEVKKLKKEDLDKAIGTEVMYTRIACELMPLEAIKKIKC